MRKAILEKFIFVLLAALCINSVIFYIASRNTILDTTKKDMLYTMEILDQTLDYEGDLAGQVQRMENFTAGNPSRLTLIRTDGTVVSDSDADPAELDNHLSRKEVVQAMKKGSGFAERYSHTLKRNLLYVAYRSNRADMIIRVSVPYSGASEYLTMLLPAALFSFLAALACALVVSKRFVDSVTQPLSNIAAEMSKVKGDYKGDYTELHFEKCQYPELNVIAETTMEMSKNVKAYLSRIDKEKQIRQEFFSNASHELKTPITSIQGYAELMESGMIQDENMKMDFIKRIKREAINMAGLINDILMISRLEAKDAEVVVSDVRVSVLLEEIIDSLKPAAAAGQVFIHCDCQPLSIKANPQQMKELLSNLVSNAVKYNRPGGQGWVNIREKDGNMVARVRDNGVGIPQESLDRIFERFYRVDKGRSRKQGGTGLGLSIVKHIVNFYHGTIRVTSQLDEGTEFVVTIPLNWKDL